jgi:hypothetical protein
MKKEGGGEAVVKMRLTMLYTGEESVVGGQAVACFFFFMLEEEEELVVGEEAVVGSKAVACLLVCFWNLDSLLGSFLLLVCVCTRVCAEAVLGSGRH